MTKHEVVAVAGEKTAIPCDCTPTSSHPGDDNDDCDDVFFICVCVCLSVRSSSHPGRFGVMMMMMMYIL